MCAACSQEIDLGVQYCPRCGTPNPEAPTIATPTGGGAAQPPAAGGEIRGRLQGALGRDFIVEEPIGQGGFATVYAVQDRKLSRRIAVKVLHPDLTASLSTVGRFIREAEAAASLSHPHILPIFFVGEGQGLVYFGMPLVEGETLDQLLGREGQLPEDEVVRIGAEIAEALADAHAREIVHRDVKPANVLLQGPRRRVLVADFGIAKAATGSTGTLTGSGVVIGSPHYMSPEQASGSGDVDGRSDVYALGIVLWQMLTGRVPFDAPDSRDVLMQHLTRPIPPVRASRSSVRPALARVVERCAAKNRGDRFQTAQDVAEALRAAVSAEQPTPERRSRSRALLAAGTVVVAAAAVAGAILLRGAGGDGPGAETGVAGGRPVAPVVAVLPFEVGNPRDSARGRETARLLTNAMATRFAVATVDVNRLLGQWATERRTTAAALESNAAFAYGHGANQVVVGSSIEAGAQLRLTADVYDTRTLTRIGYVERTGDADSLFVLVDRLAGDVAQALCDQPAFNPRNLCYDQPPRPTAPVAAVVAADVPDSAVVPAFQVRVDREGAMSDVRIDQASSPEATQAALEALQTTRFVPARRRGAPVDAWARVEVPLRRLVPAAEASPATAARVVADSSASVVDCGDPEVSVRNPGNACYETRPVPRVAPIAPVPASCRGVVTPVTLVVQVAVSGEVAGEPLLQRRSSCADFDAVTSVYVLDLTFRPAVKNGRFVASHAAVLVRPARVEGKTP